MTASSDGGGKALVPSGSVELVVRSEVPKGLQYPDYREYLRYDFFHSCAYCTIGETEAQAINFTIDHYEPQRAKPEMANDYDNLMYACNPCNVYKGDRTPPPEARAEGYRFFRPDKDVYDEHFERKARRVEHRTNIGYYTIQALELNRQGLRRLRELRERLSDCDEFVMSGLVGLRKFQLDALPKHLKGRAARAIQAAYITGNQIADSIDSLLRAHAHSPLIDKDVEAKLTAKERAAKLKQLEAIHPGVWRGRASGPKGA